MFVHHSAPERLGSGAKFARIVFTIAALYGFVTIIPFYFSEHRLALEYPPPITHPEFYYAFAGVCLVWQILFVFIAVNPERCRIIMIPCMLEKLSLLPAFFILAPENRFPKSWLPLLAIDLVLGALFFVAFKLTKR